MNLNEELEEALNKEKRGKESRLSKTLRLYIVPVVTLIAFIFTIFFLVLPKLGSIFESLLELSEKSATLSNRQQELLKIQTLANNRENLSTDLATINALAPEGNTQVVNFQEKIARMASESNVIITNQKLSDSIQENPENRQFSLVLREVPSIFNLVGTFDNILTFINRLSNIDDFVVIREMELSFRSSSAGVNEWFLDLTLIKYQFGVLDAAKASAEFLTVPVDATLNPTIREYIDSKVQNRLTDSNVTEF